MIWENSAGSPIFNWKIGSFEIQFSNGIIGLTILRDLDHEGIIEIADFIRTITEELPEGILLNANGDL